MIEWALFVVSTILIWYFNTRLPNNYPPTPPTRLPFLGHAHYLILHRTTDIYEVFRRYNRDGVLALHIGTWRFTVFGKHDIIRDVFSREETNLRDPHFAAVVKKVRNNSIDSPGIIFGHGKHWQEQRRFMLSTLKDFGVGKTTIEGSINDEVAYFCQYLEEMLISKLSSYDENIRPKEMFHIPIINVLWQIVARERYEYEDQKLVGLRDKLVEMMNVPLFQPNAATFFPFLEEIFPSASMTTEQHQCYAVISEIKAFLNVTIKQHRDTFDPDNIRDFIDTYLLEIQERGVKGTSFHASQGEEHLVNTLLDLFIAGMDTTSNTLSFAILFMVNNQEVQNRVRQEIFDVIGQTNQPSLKDKAEMPYTEATILEIQRMANIAPDGVPHATKSSIMVGPYAIPQGHVLMSNLTTVMRDEEEWVKPHTFDPSRFIRNGQIIKSEALIPFSAGKRQCPGENLARAELFLFFVGLIQKFKFETMNPGDKMEIVIQKGVTWKPLLTEPIKVTKI